MRRRLHDRASARRRILGLEDPGSDEDAVDTELHHQRRVGRGRETAGGEVHDREPSGGRDVANQLQWSAEILRRAPELLRTQHRERRHLPQHGSLMADGLHDVAGARLALRADHRRALSDPAEGLAEVARATHERNRESPLVDVVLLVGRRQDFALVDVVDPQRLEHLRLDEMLDARLRHHRDGDRVDDLLDLGRIGHAGDAAFRSDVRGDALERHDGDRSGILGDLRRVRGRDVHDHAAFQHLRQAGLHSERSGVAFHRGSLLEPQFAQSTAATCGASRNAPTATQVVTAMPAGTSSTQVFPGWSGISSPDRSSKTVRSETFGRFQLPWMQWPFRHTYALPPPVGITSGETTPFTSLTGPCFVFTTWITTFFAETWSPFSKVWGTVP